MLWSRSQLNENTQGDFSILQQISALRKENRFLKVGLIFCLVLSAMPYLTGFQPTVIRASKIVTEKIEFVSDGEKVASIVVHPNKTGLVIQDKNAKGLVFLGTSVFGGAVSVYNCDGKTVASIGAFPDGGVIYVTSKDGKGLALIKALPDGGTISVQNKDGKELVSIGASLGGGEIYVWNKDEKCVIMLDTNRYGGEISVLTNDGKLVAQMRSDRDGGVIAVGDKKGRLIWSTP